MIERFRPHHASFGVFLAIVVMMGCGSSSPGPDPVSTVRTTSVVTSQSTTSIFTTVPTSTTISSGSGTLSFSVVDGCSDGRGLQVKFFDETRNLVWPDASTHYVVAAGGTLNQT